MTPPEPCIKGRGYSLIAGFTKEQRADLRYIAENPRDTETMMVSRDYHDAAPDFVAILDQLDRAEAKAQEQHDIVARIWVQLGSPTYEQLAGRSIHDMVDELKSRVEATP